MGSPFGPQGASIGSALGFFLISGMLSIGCVNRTGEPLDPGLMAFPIAIEIAEDLDAEGRPRFVYVTSSNFALQYNSGNVQSYDLEKLVDGIFNGCVDSHHVLIDGTPDTVRATTREVLDIMKPGGGFIAGASHDWILPETPVDNLLAMFDTIGDYGRYG